MAGKLDTFIDNSAPSADAAFLNMEQTERNTFISSSAQTPSDSILDQVSKAAAVYSGQGGIYCTASGAVNDYVLTQIAPLKAPPIATLRIGTTIVFRPTIDNTGPCTANPFGHGVNSIKLENGTSDPGAGELSTTRDAKIIWNGTVWLLSGKPVSSTEAVQGISYLPKQITISNNVGTPTSMIDFTAGNFQFYDGSGQGTMTAKTGDLANLFGTSDGMLDVVTVAIDSTYYLFTVYNPTTGLSKPLASLSLTSPTMTLPNADGYTVLGKKIASLITDGSANIYNGTWSFNQDGSYSFRYLDPMTFTSSSDPGTSEILIPLDVPPLTIPLAQYLFTDTTGTSAKYAAFTSSLTTDTAASSSNFTNIVSEDQSEYSTYSGLLLTDSSSRIRLRISNSDAGTFYSYHLSGWTDNNL
tara:strand:- start:23952 stop:25190 length:1239 start_codon:yes stop_codon:yes gene_type:complete